MASRRAMCSTMLSSGPSVPRVDSRVSPSAVSCLEGLRRRRWPARRRRSPPASAPSPPPAPTAVAPGPAACRSRSRAVEPCGLLLSDAAAHLYRAVVPQKTPDLPGDFGHSVGGKLRAVGRVKPLHRLEKANAAQLVQVVRLHPPADSTAARCSRSVRCFPAAPARQASLSPFWAPVQQRPSCSALIRRRRAARGDRFAAWSRWCPSPARSAPSAESIKLSIMVKPMPLRSSPPVVNSGCRACSTSGDAHAPVPHRQSPVRCPARMRSFITIFPSCVRIGVDDGVGHRLADGGFDVSQSRPAWGPAGRQSRPPPRGQSPRWLLRLRNSRVT